MWWRSSLGGEARQLCVTSRSARAMYRHKVPSDNGLPPSGVSQADPFSCSFSRAYSRTSQNSAPSSRMRSSSSTRRATVALLAFGFGPAASGAPGFGCLVGLPFMPGHQVQDPGRMPVAQAGVVDQDELFLAASVAAPVGAALH